MIPERFGRTINQYFMGIGLSIVIAGSLWPLQVISWLRTWLAAPPDEKNVLGGLLLLTGPLIALGAAVESLARICGRLAATVSHGVRSSYRFTYSSAHRGPDLRREHGAAVLASTQPHVFTWITEHLVRGKFAAAWAILWALAIVPTGRFSQIGALTIGIAIILCALELTVFFLLFLWSLHQLETYSHYLTSFMEHHESTRSDADIKTSSSA